MKHEALLPFFDEQIPMSVFFNPDNPSDSLKSRIEKSTPKVSPGTRYYHALTRGLIENELVKLVDPQKRDLGIIFQEEIAQPLGVDCWIGHFPKSEIKRVFPMTQIPVIYAITKTLIPFYLGTLDSFSATTIGLSFDPTSLLSRTFLPRVGRTLTDTSPYSTFEEVNAVSPSAGGITNAKSMGRILDMLASGGEINGVRILQESTINLMLGNPTDKLDGCLNRNYTFTRGGLSKDMHIVNYMTPGASWYGWMGWGGSVSMFNPTTRSVLSYTMNGMTSSLIGDKRTQRVFEGIAKNQKLTKFE